MKWKPAHVSRGALLLLSLLSLLALAVAEQVRGVRPRPHLEERLRAARSMAQAIRVISEYRQQAGYEFDLERDPRRTGLIGTEFTPITTDRGTLSAKQIVTNPNFAALVLQLFKEAGLEEGDTVAVAWTGSLPGANIAVIAAAETLGLRLVPIASVAASMSGANDPDFAWLDMEKLLVDRGVFSARSIMATMGGDEDRGKGVGRVGRAMMASVAERVGLKLVRMADFEEQRHERMAVYRERAGQQPIKAYVNVGGGIGSLGARINGQLLRPGLNRTARGMHFARDGVMTLMLKDGVPVVHVNYIHRLCRRYGFPEDPEAFVAPGTGPMFYEDEHIVALVAVLLVGLLIVDTVTIRMDEIRERRRRRKRRLPDET